MAIEPAAISARPAVTTIAESAIAPVSPAASANGTVRPSAIPMTMSRTTWEAVKWRSMCGVCGIAAAILMQDRGEEEEWPDEDQKKDEQRDENRQHHGSDREEHGEFDHHGDEDDRQKEQLQRQEGQLEGELQRGRRQGDQQQRADGHHEQREQGKKRKHGCASLMSIRPNLRRVATTAGPAAPRKPTAGG